MKKWFGITVIALLLLFTLLSVMAFATALASTDVTVTTLQQERFGRLKANVVTVAFGNSSLTYPSGGVPLPALSKFGVSKVTFVSIWPPYGSGYIYRYDATNHKILVYYGNYDSADGPLIETTTGYAPASTTLTLMVWGK